MGIISGFGRCFVVVLNITFVIISLLLIIGGAIAYKASEIGLIKGMEDKIKGTLSLLASKTGNENDGISGFSVSELLDDIGMALIIFGCVLLFLSFCGCCGACCKFRTLIFIYGLIIAVLLLAEVIVVILMYAVPSTIQGHIKDVLFESLKQYQGIRHSDVNTLGWMFVMSEMKCCGVNGYTDFFNYATTWDNKPGNVATIYAPLVCCKTAPTGSNAADLDCARNGTLDINEEGCFDVVWGKVLGNSVYASLGFGSGFTFQALLVIFSILIYIDLGKKDKGKVHPEA